MEQPAYPMSRSCPMRPPDRYTELRAGAPLEKITLPSGRTAWLITRYEHVRRFLADRNVSTNRLHPNFPFYRPLAHKLIGVNASLMSLDPPAHAVLTRMVIPEFTHKRVQKLRPLVQRIVDDHITTMLDGDRPIDLVDALCRPVTAQVICEVLGAPYRDRELFRSTSKAMADWHSSLREREEADAALRGYLSDFVAAKVAEAEQPGAVPGDHLVGRLIAKNREERVLSQEDIAALCLSLLSAGHETTANVIALGTVLLLENPEQLAVIRADPTRTPGAVEEILRHTSITDPSGLRVALADIEVGDMVVKEGDGVVVSTAAANWDDSVFAEPEKLDFDRDARHQLAFGHGIHRCVAQNLARLELEIAFTTLFARVPGLRLAAPVEELDFKDGALLYGVHTLPVTW
ncbi:cytochrome P450 [Actinokineospora auranticolor]|uniref:Cytochrome P450 n=1 Tax=Actinokineospora auranticolor TaxID=155976 RepID=A0A2S6GJ70_9PSEU|nr:cytochrome P450 [Actinokineospora auranticolor]PPK65233.1 cytochrome P450 [Actinokineospora auranticolor]